MHFTINNTYTRDHDSAAGYGGRIGYRYCTAIQVCVPSADWVKARRSKAGIGGYIVDVANYLYRTYGFQSTHNPQVDVKARGKQGTTTVLFEYFHNSDQDAQVFEYTGYALNAHKRPNGRYGRDQGDLSRREHNADGIGPDKGSQYDLDVNRGK